MPCWFWFMSTSKHGLGRKLARPVVWSTLHISWGEILSGTSYATGWEGHVCQSHDFTDLLEHNYEFHSSPLKGFNTQSFTSIVLFLILSFNDQFFFFFFKCLDFKQFCVSIAKRSDSGVGTELENGRGVRRFHLKAVHLPFIVRWPSTFKKKPCVNDGTKSFSTRI